MKRLRIVSYAINGRGLGHLVRQLAILRWVRRYAALIGVPTGAVDPHDVGGRHRSRGAKAFPKRSSVAVEGR